MQRNTAIFLLLISFVLIQTVFAQGDKNLPVLPGSANNLEDFVPNGWKIVRKLESDLNSDNSNETILILQGDNQNLIKEASFGDFNSTTTDKETDKTRFLADNNPVILAIFSKDKNGYKLAAQNSQIIPAFENNWYRWKYAVSFEDKTLKVELSGKISSSIRDNFGETKRSFNFQFQNSKFVLVEAEETSWFQSMLVSNSRKDSYKKYDFLQKNGYLAFTEKLNKEIEKEELYKVRSMIPFEKVSFDSTDSIFQLKSATDYKIAGSKKNDKKLIEVYNGLQNIGFLNQKNQTSKTEIELVEKEIREKAEETKRFGKTKDFECEQNLFQIIDWANGTFIKTNEKNKIVKVNNSFLLEYSYTVEPQNAFLYQLCLNGIAQYAAYLGGIILIEKEKVAGHYVFANISGFNRIRSLPDINRNGLSELALEFSHNIDSLSFSNAIGIYEYDGKTLAELGETDIFQRLEDDKAYKIFVKSGKTPAFYQETFTSQYEKNEWIQTEKLKKVKLEKTVETLMSLPDSKSENYAAPTYSAKEVSQKVLQLIKSIKNFEQISPNNLEKVIGGKIIFDEENKNRYGYAGKISDSDWFYQIFSLTEANGEPSRRLEFSFERHDDKEDDLSPVCEFTYDDYKKTLLADGFKVTPLYGEHGRHLYWQFEKGNIEVKIISYKYEQNECVKTLWINI